MHHHSHEQMKELRNLSVALALVIIIVGGWQYFYAVPQQRAAYAARQAAEQAAGKSAVKTDVVQEKALTVSAPKTNEELVAETASARLKIEAPRIEGSILLQGARLDDLVLKDYKETLAENSGSVPLLAPSLSAHPYFTEFGWLSSGKLAVPDRSSKWKSNRPTLTPETPVTLSWENGQGQRFELEIALDKHYMFTVTQRVINQSDNAISVTPYALINRSWDAHETLYIQHEGPLGVFNEILEEVSYGDLKELQTQSFNTTKGWVGFTDKYWLTALIPDSAEGFNATLRHEMKNDQDRYQVDAVSKAVVVDAGTTHTQVVRVFAGAKEVKLLDKYLEKYSIPLFDRAIDFGTFYLLTIPLFHALNFLKDVLGEFGLAILALTVVVRLILFPVANKSYKAMSQMRKFHPQMMELKERYKDDKAEFQKQLMEFYKKHKINPASGCLPLLIQIPIFFSLYKVFYITIEMRHTAFIGWIQDLSAPDPTNILNLFGLIDWVPPLWLPAIGAWPILMMITMFLQQRLNPPMQDPTQQMVMRLMPIIMVFLFAQFSAGLVIYWTWNNILSILQQWVITRKLQAPETVAAPSSK